AKAGRRRSPFTVAQLVLAGVMLLAVTAGAAPKPTNDRDGDGVIDTLDDCLTVPNADQRDTDRDGIGNACDPDFNQDGIVDATDIRLLGGRMGPTDAGSLDDYRRRRDFDLNGDGVVDATDLALANRYAGRKPGPVLDTDRDGTPDHLDPCP